MVHQGRNFVEVVQINKYEGASETAFVPQVRLKQTLKLRSIVIPEFVKLAARK